MAPIPLKSTQTSTYFSLLLAQKLKTVNFLKDIINNEFSHAAEATIIKQRRDGGGSVAV